MCDMIKLKIHHRKLKIMKRILIPIFMTLLLLSGCGPAQEPAQVAATTLPVYQFTSMLCQGTGITVARLVTESVSCLHDYTLQVSQMRTIETAGIVVISGAGLEEFMEDALEGANAIIDASAGVTLLESGTHEAHEEDHEGHHHEHDPHIWLSPENAKCMAQNICDGLTAQFPAYAETFSSNLGGLLAQLDALQAYGEKTLADLSCRELITFHDGFAYFADAFDLTILEALEEESGSEASAAELIHLIELAEAHDLPAIFTETNGSTAAAAILARECGIGSCALDMAMAGDDYFEAMYHNIDTIKEALG